MLVNRSMPRCTVIPELPYDQVGNAIEWLTNVFGFSLRLRIADHRAQMNVGDGVVVLIEGQATVKVACSVMVRVEDVDSHYERARRNGARILREPVTYPYGERQYTAEDCGGHRWTFSQSMADVDPREWGGTPGQL